VIDCLGETTSNAADLLAKAGISDAYLYLRKPSELSDGQRYRVKLAKVMETDADVWVADEFGAVLDRETAKVIAFNVSKVARRLGKTLLVATTHTDLEEELGPNLSIYKRFRERVDIKEERNAA
jgi:ABC-type ATPase with predicted acetyltransferase domain